MARQLTELQRRFHIALLVHVLTVEAVAREVGIAPTSLRNIINGSAVSDDTRQRITNAVQEQLWDDVSLEFHSVFEPGDEITSPTVAQAVETEHSFRDFVERHGRVVRFIKPALFILRHPISCEQHRVRNQPEVASAP